MPRPASYFTRKRGAMREFRRREKHRKPDELSTRVWLCKGGYLGRCYYVGIALPTRITNSTAVTEVVAEGREV
jgi:hypothetical protein